MGFFSWSFGDHFREMIKGINSWWNAVTKGQESSDWIFEGVEVKFKLYAFCSEKEMRGYYFIKHQQEMPNCVGLAWRDNDPNTNESELWILSSRFKNTHEHIFNQWALGHELNHLLQYMSDRGELDFKIMNPDKWSEEK